VTLPLCGLFFGTVIHFVRCVRKKKLEKRREIELYSSKVKRKTEILKQEFLYSNEKYRAEVQQVTLF